ncbi:helix-turn-helix domain-containing protein [Anaerostipes hadrus]|jgi:transcriptional regulator with XRE-family HTH domain|nr:helix-turn-helix transcriptional regulator [Anaerostipes hadrus]MBT9903730.1 helix-turn-helix domain-containing protein [Anaerostipes hadrus]
MISLFCLLIMSKTEIGKRIRNIRILNGLSQSELGEKLGLTADRIQKYENGARNPKVSMIFRIANALDVNAAALYDPTPCDDLSTMFFFFEMEEKYGMTIKKIVDDDGNVKYAVVANSENRMYDYLSKWHDAYICKKIESKLVDTQEERERILEDYARWKSKFPKSIENSKDLKENQKQKLKKKIEELQSEYERLHLMAENSRRVS